MFLINSLGRTVHAPITSSFQQISCKSRIGARTLLWGAPSHVSWLTRSPKNCAQRRDLRHEAFPASLCRPSRHHRLQPCSSTPAPADASTSRDSDEFDWMTALTMAGCAFEAYNGLQEGAGPLRKETIGGTHVTYVDPTFLRTRMDGILEVTVVRARDLKAADLFPTFKSDPYCVISVGSSCMKTPVVMADLNPTWDHTAYVFVENLASQRLTLRVLDQDFGKADDFLGAGMRGLGDLEDGQPREVEIALTGQGVVTLRLQFERFGEGDEVLQQATSSRMGCNVIGSPAQAILSSPWRSVKAKVLQQADAAADAAFDPVAFVDNAETDSQAWMFWNPVAKTAAIAFRGTEQDRFRDVLTDLDLQPTLLDPEGTGDLGSDADDGAPSSRVMAGLKKIAEGILQDGHQADLRSLVIEGAREAAKKVDDQQEWAHSGFLKAYRSIRTEVLQTLDGILGGEGEGPSQWRVYVTGHSLGGALSTLCAYELATRRAWSSDGGPQVINYSFGSPRVGNRAFAKTFNEAVPNAWRVVNSLDAVASVPRMMGYCHVGHVVRLMPNGEVEVERDSMQGLGEGAEILDVAAAAVTTALEESGAAGISDGPSIATKDDIVAVLQREREALNTLLDGQGVTEHLEPLYLENLEKLVAAYYKDAENNQRMPRAFGGGADKRMDE